MSPRASHRTMTIGSVLRALANEFPDISVSKLRFLETEGLVTPGRTDSGYRVYSADDLERLRYVLRAQRDRFWPLKVIKESLDALDRGLRAPAAQDQRPAPPAVAEDHDLPPVEELTTGRPLRLTRAEIAASAGCAVAAVETLDSFGLIHADAGGHYDETALAVAKAAGELAAYGLEPRHLRTFKNAADREIGLVEQALGPSPGDDGEHVSREAHLLRACIALHTALVRSGLRARR